MGSYLGQALLKAFFGNPLTSLTSARDQLTSFLNDCCNLYVCSLVTTTYLDRPESVGDSFNKGKKVAANQANLNKQLGIILLTKLIKLCLFPGMIISKRIISNIFHPQLSVAVSANLCLFCIAFRRYSLSNDQQLNSQTR